MAVSVLVMTPVRSFGELIQQALQETGLYRATLVNSNEQALERVRAEPFPVAVLDFDLDPNPAELVTALYAAQPELRIVAMKNDPGAEISLMNELPLAACLEDAFYLPDLLDALDEVTADLEGSGSKFETPETEHTTFPSGVLGKKTPDKSREAPEWLQDVSRAAQHLTRLSLESAAQAALIARSGQLWAYAGQLSQPAAEELARSVGHYWTHDGGSDLARFIRLDATGEEYMLYATGLGGEYVLALAFETEIPFSEIRSQASDLARRLAKPPQETESPTGASDSPLGDSAPVSESQPEEILVPLPADEVIQAEVELTHFLSDWRPDQAVIEEQQAFFEDLLSAREVPQPNVHQAQAASLGMDQAEVAMVKDLPETGEAEEEFSGVVAPHKSGDEAPEFQTDEPVPDYLKGGHPTQIRDHPVESQLDQLRAENLDPVNPALHNLTYSCVLVPRLPQHHLVGDLAIRLNQWIVQFSLAFGWRLEHLAIRPNYLRWVAVVPPATSPGHMVRTLRQHASQRIFAEFPRLARENPSGDFWAPGYLIINGRDTLSQDLVQEFIRKTRIRQGVAAVTIEKRAAL